MAGSHRAITGAAVALWLCRRANTGVTESRGSRRGVYRTRSRGGRPHRSVQPRSKCTYTSTHGDPPCPPRRVASPARPSPARPRDRSRRLRLDARAESSNRTDAEWQERANPSAGAVFVAASEGSPGRHGERRPSSPSPGRGGGVRDVGRTRGTRDGDRRGPHGSGRVVGTRIRLREHRPRRHDGEQVGDPASTPARLCRHRRARTAFARTDLEIQDHGEEAFDAAPSRSVARAASAAPRSTSRRQDSTTTTRDITTLLSPRPARDRSRSRPSSAMKPKPRGRPFGTSDRPDSRRGRGRPRDLRHRAAGHDCRRGPGSAPEHSPHHERLAAPQDVGQARRSSRSA